MRRIPLPSGESLSWPYSEALASEVPAFTHWLRHEHGVTSLDDPRVLDLIRTEAVRRVDTGGGDFLCELVSVTQVYLFARKMPPLVYMMRPAASGLVHETDLASLPGELPNALAWPFVIETRRPETGERLFGECISIAGQYFRKENERELPGLAISALFWRDDTNDVGAQTWTWDLFDGEDITDALRKRHSSDCPERGCMGHEDRELAQAMRFIIVLGLLLEAEKTPFLEKGEACANVKARHIGPTSTTWVTRHIYLNAEAQRRASAEPQTTLDKDGLLSAEVPVRGHLKRQHHGEGNSLVKWIYVEGYSQRKWIAPRPVRNVVGVRMQ